MYYVNEAYGFNIKFVFRLGEPCSSFGTTGNFHGNKTSFNWV